MFVHTIFTTTYVAPVHIHILTHFPKPDKEQITHLFTGNVITIYFWCIAYVGVDTTSEQLFTKTFSLSVVLLRNMSCVSFVFFFFLNFHYKNISHQQVFHCVSLSTRKCDGKKLSLSYSYATDAMNRD